MQLNNLIELTNNLNQAYALYLKIHQQSLPLAKVTVTAQACLLYPGKRAMTKQHLFNLVRRIHHRQVTVWMVNRQKQIPVYGIQVSVDKKIVILM